jgi:fatty-acyl-CoA synthase
VLLPNRAEYISAWVGLTKLGIAAALINNNLTGAALAHCLSISNADHVITDNESLAATETIRAGLARPLKYWVIDAELSTSSRSPRLGLERTQARARATAGLPARGHKGRDVALYIYTSGTTGMPKAAKITHMRAQLYMRSFAGDDESERRRQNLLRAAALSRHGRPVRRRLCAAKRRHGRVAAKVLRITHFWDDVVDHDCTMFVYIGELCRYLVNQDPGPKDRAHKLRLAFGNGLRPEVWDEFQARFNCPADHGILRLDRRQRVDVQLRRPPRRNRPRAALPAAQFRRAAR